MNETKIVPGNKTIGIVIGVTVASIVIILVVVLSVVLTAKKTSHSSRSSSNATSSSAFVPPIYNLGVKEIGTPQVGSGNIQGFSVAVSSDGSTIAVGSPGDNNNVGAVFIYIYASGAWSLQTKLIGTGGTSPSQQGISVALSANGNILAIGGPLNNNDAGAIWIFSRSGTTWTQVYVTTDGLTDQLGYSVSINNNGTLVIAGAPAYSTTGRCNFYYLTSGNWSYLTSIIGTGVSSSSQGLTVTMSGDGSTVAFSDSESANSIWLFYSQNVSTWVQLGRINIIGATNFGFGMSLSLNGTVFATTLTLNGVSGYGAVYSVNSVGPNKYINQISLFLPTGGTTLVGTLSSISLSPEGNLLVIGNGGDNSNIGATWIFNNAHGTNFLQSYPKIVGSSMIGASKQGASVSMSNNGNIFVVGAPGDNAGVGAFWIFNAI